MAEAKKAAPKKTSSGPSKKSFDELKVRVDVIESVLTRALGVDVSAEHAREDEQ